MVQATRVRFADEANVNIQSFKDRGLQLPTQRTFKDSGAMIAPATLARVGIMSYLAKECGAAFADMDPNAVVKIMTRPEDLFDPESLESYRAAPITIGHPDDDNFAQRRRHSAFVQECKRSLRIRNHQVQDSPTICRMV